MLASNAQVNLFHRGFKACDDYRAGEAAMGAVTCPVLFVLGRADQMTQPRAAQSLRGAAAHAKLVTLDAGHQLMSECPDGVLGALLDFLKPPA